MLHFAQARLYFTKGKYNEALDKNDKSIEELISNGLPPDALILTGAYLLKSEILNNLGQYKEALTQSEKIYNIQKNIKKETNEVFAIIYTKMARALFGLGEKDKALGYANKALEIFKGNNKNFAEEQMLSVNNVEIANACVVYGDILVSIDKLGDALKSYMKAQTIYFNLYGKNRKNVEQVNYLNLQGSKAACKNKDTRMYKDFGKPQVMEFGLKNPNTIEMFRYCKSYDMHLTKKKTYIEKQN